MSNAGGLRAELLAGGPARLGQPARWGGRAALLAVLAAYVAALAVLDVTPGRIWAGLGRLSDVAALMLPPTAGGHAALYLAALGQTLAIAFLGTLAASALALPAAFLAARNVVANRVVHVLARRTLDAVRSIDTLIWALIWINVVGLGPFAGALAIATSDFGALAKLMSEAVENADRRQTEGVAASGGGKLMAIRYGLLPQIMPVFVSQALYFFESNVRSASIIGIVGAGGIGLHLYEAIRVLEWRQASFLILLILAAVAAIDVVSRRLRSALIGAPH